MTPKEQQTLKDHLHSRWNDSIKCQVGDLNVGSIVLARFEDPFDPEYGISYAFLLIYRKNKKEVRLTESLCDGSFALCAKDYRMKNNEEVMHLVNFDNSEGLYK